MMKQLLFYCSFLFLSTSLWAKSVNLYTSPSLNAKIATTVTAGTKLSPIYYPKKGEPGEKKWIKVVVPENGKVGWLFLKDLDPAKKRTNMKNATAKQTFTEEETKNGKKTYRTIELYGFDKMDSKQAKKLIINMQQRHQNMRQHMDKIIEELFEKFGAPWENSSFDDFIINNKK